MSTPMSAERLAAIRALLDGEDRDRADMDDAMYDLLGEVDRLIAVAKALNSGEA